jgi:putative transposase
MSYVRIWIHLVFSTKYREKTLYPEIRRKVHAHIIENCANKDIFLQSINGVDDHLHCLISLKREQSLAHVANLIKGESSYWINKQGFMKEKFLWQDDYYAISVSESRVPIVINYIKNQEAHHFKKNFESEIREITANYQQT